MLPDLKLSLGMLSSSHVKMPYPVPIVFTIMMLVARMTPMPHVVEKILMLTKWYSHQAHWYFRILILKFIKDRR